MPFHFKGLTVHRARAPRPRFNGFVAKIDCRADNLCAPRPCRLMFLSVSINR